MRCILTTDQAELFQKFTRLLDSKKITWHLEEKGTADWGSPDYGTKKYEVWIIDEDSVAQAKKLLDELQKTPSLFEQIQSDAPKPLLEQKSTPTEPPSPGQMIRKKRRFSLTHFLLAFCSIILLLTIWSSPDSEKIPRLVQEKLIATSPVEQTLLFDYPEKYELLDRIASIWGYEALLKPNELPPSGQFLYKNWLHTHAWNGIYPILVSHEKDMKKSLKEAPLFEKIREGEFWRFITPVVLHGDILHLFFNMIWLLILGAQIESRVGLFRYFLLIILGAIIPNTAQYLVSGPAFIGFSGVVCAFAFFVYERQKKAPWEGYILSQGTFQFILFFIGALAFLSGVTFVLDFFGFGYFPIQIANTAHIVGALTGWTLGHFDFFSWHRFE
jgi:GlpG protein